jgi:hypothetical protein
MYGLLFIEVGLLFIEVGNPDMTCHVTQLQPLKTEAASRVFDLMDCPACTTFERKWRCKHVQCIPQR